MDQRIDREKWLANYDDWLALIDRVSDRFKVEWPDGALKAHVVADEIVVCWKFGQLGRIYREKCEVVFHSDSRETLRELEADVPGLEFQDALYRIEGWRTNDGLASDLDRAVRVFWTKSFEEAQLYWDGRRPFDRFGDA